MEGFPLALVAENPPNLELLVGGNFECTIIYTRLEETIESSLDEDQFGFRKKGGLEKHYSHYD